MEKLPKVGVGLPVSFTRTPPIDQQRDAVRRLEAAGYRAAWVNEVIGKDALVQVAILLAATESMVLGTGIANIWARPAPTLAAAAGQLAQAYPGRFVLGLGVGSPPQAEAVGLRYGRPLATMRTYWEQLSAPTSPPAPAAEYPRLIAAFGPKMLGLAASLADGVLPAGMPAERTASARAELGPDKLLVVGARITDTPAELVKEHLDAGADHVLLMLDRGVEYAAGIQRLEHLAPAVNG